MVDGPIHVSTASDGEHYTALGALRCKIPSQLTGGAFTVLELVLEPGQGAGLHQHQHEDELLIVQGGSCTVGDRQRTWQLAAGGCAFFPRRAAHAFRNDGAEPCMLLITAVPGGLDHYFTALNTAVAAQDAAAIDAINTAYGITQLAD
jgi:quercetin dioxygenase-like cupin family protein